MAWSADALLLQRQLVRDSGWREDAAAVAPFLRDVNWMRFWVPRDERDALKANRAAAKKPRLKTQIAAKQVIAQAAKLQAEQAEVELAKQKADPASEG
jgi:hypothetical protein